MRLSVRYRPFSCDVHEYFSIKILPLAKRVPLQMNFRSFLFVGFDRIANRIEIVPVPTEVEPDRAGGTRLCS